MKLSVIIPCLNAERTIAAQLEALANQDWSEPWEVILADGGSSDRTIAIAEQYREKLPNLQIIDSKDRRGAAHGRNAGAQAAKSPALAFCEADDEVGAGWVAVMGEALSQYDFVAGYCEIKKLNQPWAIKARTGGKLLDGWEDGILTENSLIKYPIAGGYMIGVKRSVHEAIGGFDESMIGDDVDYSWRVQLAGTKLHHIPNLIVHYRLRHSLTDIYRQAYVYGKATVVLQNKHQSSGVYLRLLDNINPDWRLLGADFLRIRRKEELGLWSWKLGYSLGYQQAARECDI